MLLCVVTTLLQWRHLADFATALHTKYFQTGLRFEDMFQKNSISLNLLIFLNKTETNELYNKDDN